MIIWKGAVLSRNTGQCYARYIFFVVVVFGRPPRKKIAFSMKASFAGACMNSDDVGCTCSWIVCVSCAVRLQSYFPQRRRRFQFEKSGNRSCQRRDYIVSPATSSLQLAAAHLFEEHKYVRVDANQRALHRIDELLLCTGSINCTSCPLGVEVPFGRQATRIWHHKATTYLAWGRRIPRW